MIQSKRALVIALAFPIAALVGLALMKARAVAIGREVTLPISGYDPRDLLSGHYLRYQIDYGVEGVCGVPGPTSTPDPSATPATSETAADAPGASPTPAADADASFVPKRDQEAYICLQPDRWFSLTPRDCDLMIRGNCFYNRFEAGVEKFYVPENRAQELEKMIRDKKAEIVLSVSADGSAHIKNLLIDGHLWNDELKK